MSDFELPAGSERKPSRRANLPETKVPAPVDEKVKEVGDDEPVEKPKYEKEELLKIFDEIIFSGEYTEEVVVKGRLRVSFRTRAAGEIEEISRIVDTMQANLISTLNEKRSVLNLQYAMTNYQGKDLRGMKVEDKAKFIKALPGPVIGALLGALMRFDEKVFEACKEGEENF